MGSFFAGLAMVATMVLGSSHYVGTRETMQVRGVERAAFVLFDMRDKNAVAIHHEASANLDEPLFLNHLQVITSSATSGLLSIDTIYVGDRSVCSVEDIAVGPDRNVLRAIASATESPCSGAVLHGGPLGSELVLVAPGEITVRFGDSGVVGEELVIGILSYPGSRVAVDGIDF